MAQLKDYTGQYSDMVLAQIVRIQRWFRAKKSKKFFKTLLQKDLDREKVNLGKNLRKMEMDITERKQKMDEAEAARRR